MEIVKIEKISFVNEVYKQLRELIMSGAWKEGKKLDGENQLAKSFQVSRVVIREAIGMLRAEHLVVTKQGVGSFVANPSNFSSPDTLIALSTQAYEEFIDFRNSV